MRSGVIMLLFTSFLALELSTEVNCHDQLIGRLGISLLQDQSGSVFLFSFSAVSSSQWLFHLQQLEALEHQVY